MKTKLELEQVLITDATSLVKATELLLSKVEDTYEYECLIDFLQKLYRRYLVWRIAKERVSFEETLWRKYPNSRFRVKVTIDMRTQKVLEGSK